MKNITFLFVFFLSINIFSQSPWTKEKGKAYTQVSFTTIPTYSTIFGDPDYKSQREISDNTLQIYAEYGLTDKTTILASIPYKMISSGDFTQDMSLVLPVSLTEKVSEAALGNIELGVKHNFYKKNWVLSGQLSVEVNTSKYYTNSGLRTGYDAWSFTPLFLAGKGKEKSYFQTFIGATIRTNEYSSNFKIGGEYGGKIFKDFWLIGFIDIVKSFKNGDVALPINNQLTSLYVNDQEYGAFGAKLIYEFSNSFGLNAGLGGAFFGNNVAKSPALTIGLYQKF